MKKSVLFFLILTSFLNSCYVYRTVEVKKGEQLPPIQEQIKPEQIYIIDVENKTYKVKAIKWENDSLVAYTNIKKEVKKNFSSHQITNVRERKFSDTRSNTLTVIAYASIGLGIFFLLK